MIGGGQLLKKTASPNTDTGYQQDGAGSQLGAIVQCGQLGRNKRTGCP